MTMHHRWTGATSHSATRPTLQEHQELALFQGWSETTNDALIFLNPLGEVVRVNRAAAQLFDRAEQELVGCPLETLFTPAGAQKLRQMQRELADRKANSALVTRVNGAGAEVTAYAFAGAAILSIGPRKDRCAWKLRCAERAGATGSWDWRIGDNRVTWSETLREIFGVAAAFEPSVDAYLQRVVAQDRERVAAQIARARDDRGSFEHDVRITRGDGERRVLHTFGTLVTGDETGDEGGDAFVGTCRDVTNDREREDRLRQSEELFREVFENAGNGIALADAIGRVVVTNGALATFLGRPDAALVGHPFADWVWREDAPAMRAAQTRLLRGVSDLERLDLRVTDGDGRSRAADVTLSVQRAHGDAVGIVMHVRDGELRQGSAELEARVAARTRDLAAANAELESFTHAVSHDLRAPLRGIDGFARALIEDHGASLDAKGINDLARIRHAAHHMGRLLDDLLMLSRVSRSELGHSSLDMTELARGVVEGLRTASPDRVVEVTIANDMRAAGDTMLVRVVLENLVSNAWKFTSRRAVAHIEIGQELTAAGPEFFVRDDGVGFEMSHGSKLFVAFRRLHDAGEFEGTGIGLATVRRILDRHGGAVWAEGALGRGATFRFTLPLAPSSFH